jgi:hypothetical protein
MFVFLHNQFDQKIHVKRLYFITSPFNSNTNCKTFNKHDIIERWGFSILCSNHPNYLNKNKKGKIYVLLEQFTSMKRMVMMFT